MIEGWAAAAVAIGGVAAAGASAYSANKQAGAAQNAQNISQNQYQNTVNLENPYNQSGVAAQNQLNYLLGDGGTTTGANTSQGGAGSLLSPFTADMMSQYSPAYNFDRQQGQQGVINGAASSQGALSGSALLGLNQYNQANSLNAFSTAAGLYNTQQQNIYQRLAGVANQGQAAASGTATAGTALAGQAAQSATNVGTAYANGANGIGTAASNAGTLGAIYAANGGGGSNPNAGVTPNNPVTYYGGVGGSSPTSTYTGP